MGFGVGVGAYFCLNPKTLNRKPLSEGVLMLCYLWELRCDGYRSTLRCRVVLGLLFSKAPYPKSKVPKHRSCSWTSVVTSVIPKGVTPPLTKAAQKPKILKPCEPKCINLALHHVDRTKALPSYRYAGSLRQTP